jgi:serine/threonine protein kinase
MGPEGARNAVSQHMPVRPRLDFLTGDQFTGAVRALAIGDTVEQFRMVEPAGCGQWIAERSEHFRQKVLIEIASGAESEQTNQRVQTRIQLLSRLRHNCIPGLLHTGILDEGCSFAVFEFAEGTPVLVWTKEKRLPVREAVRLVIECLDGLAMAHRQLVAHGALDGGRFFVDDAGHLCLPAFPLDDSRQDPVRDDMKQIADFLTSLVRAAGGRIPQDMENILARCRGDARNAPYESCDALNEDLHRFLDYRPISESSGNWLHGVSLFARRRPGIFYPFSLSAMALLLALGWSLWMEHQARVSQREAENRLHDLHQLTISLESDLYQSVRKVPNSESAQERLIRWSEESLGRLAMNADEDPAFRKELAGDYAKLAEACQENGLRDEAASLHRKEIALLRPPAGNR